MIKVPRYFEHAFPYGAINIDTKKLNLQTATNSNIILTSLWNKLTVDQEITELDNLNVVGKVAINDINSSDLLAKGDQITRIDVIVSNVLSDYFNNKFQIIHYCYNFNNKMHTLIPGFIFDTHQLYNFETYLVTDRSQALTIGKQSSFEDYLIERGIKDELFLQKIT